MQKQVQIHICTVGAVQIFQMSTDFLDCRRIQPSTTLFFFFFY